MSITEDVFKIRSWKEDNRSWKVYVVATIFKEYHWVKASLGDNNSKKWMERYKEWLADLELDQIKRDMLIGEYD